MVKMANLLRDAYALGARGAAAPRPSSVRGAGGARIALCAAPFPFLTSREGAFSGVVDSLVSTNFFGVSPQTPK